MGFFRHSRADCPFCCTCFWQSRISIDRYPGFLREVRAGFGRCLGTVRVCVESRPEFWVSWCWTQCFPQAPDFDPGTGSRSSSEPRVLTDGARLRTSPPRHKALAAKVKVMGAWVHAAKLFKLAASCPNSKTTNSPENKGGGKRPPKGQQDTVKTFNRYGSLEEDAGMEVEASQMSLPSSLSGSTSSLK